MGTRASWKAGALGAVASVSTGLSDPRPRLEGSLNHRTPSFQAAPHRAQWETPAWQTCPGPSLRRPLASLRAPGPLRAFSPVISLGRPSPRSTAAASPPRPREPLTPGPWARHP